MPSILSRFSRSNSVRSEQNDRGERNERISRYAANEGKVSLPPNSYTPPLGHAPMMANSQTGSQHNSRPVSSQTSSSFDFANRPPVKEQMTALPAHNVANTNNAHHTRHPISEPSGPEISELSRLSRTDQIVFRHFWEAKYEENKLRDLHFLKFPLFSMQPTHQDLQPYCEIYHLVKTAPGAKILSLGTASGVYIGFELFSGSRLHIEMDDAWHNITHHRIHFKTYQDIIKDHAAFAVIARWPKPLTIEFLEDKYQHWVMDWTSFCWDTTEVSELGATQDDYDNGAHMQDSLPFDHLEK
ncbi:hypothetical protein B0A52_06698 [Exophiala mesophila]|uniref:Uncharacterized protein n=1 Tax=Exophiala mesophila TaxID=212818 RepID=A0A438N1V9_EXOME|nr:hypothetical protein B0A52_06698 [Exophiala mesophila]